MSHALILTDGKAGHENQSKAFARALGCEFDIVQVKFRSRAAKVASYLLDRIGVNTSSLFSVTTQLPDTTPKVVIGTGSGTFYAAKTIAKRLNVPCGVVLYPRGYRISGFDCILAPEFDRPNQRPNIVPIPVNLVAADDAFYMAGVKAFRERHPDSGRPAVAGIVGGPNSCSFMTADWIRQQLDPIFDRYGSECEIWVTTSRRTPADVEEVVDSYPFSYKLLYSKDHFNPIPAFVSLASHLYVTAESTGMLSEACTFGTAEVHVMDNLKPGPHKFRRFAESCAALGTRKVDLSESFAEAKRLLGFA